MLHQRVGAVLLGTSAALFAALAPSCGTVAATGTGGAPGSGGSSVATNVASSTGIGFVSGVGSGTCVDASIPDDAPTGCEGLDGGVSYANEVAHIFAGCMGETCHTSWTRTSTVNVPSTECCDGRLRIAPGNATQSYLFDKIEGQDLCVQTRMPLKPFPPLPPDQILTIRRWICEGAPNN